MAPFFHKTAWLWPASVLTVASLAIGALCFTMLWREADRIGTIGREAVEEQAKAVSENLGLVVAEVKTGLLDNLLEFRGPQRSSQLEFWASSNPLASFVFFWEKKGGTKAKIYAGIESGPISEALLRSDDQWIWEGSSKRTSQIGFGEMSDDAPQMVQQNYKQRQEIRSASQLWNESVKSNFSKSAAASKEAAGLLADRSEWIPIVREKELYWVGFVVWENGNSVTGVVLRARSLQDELRKAISSVASRSVLYSVFDSSGVELSGSLAKYSGETQLGKSVGERVELRLEPELPGWRLRAVGERQVVFSTSAWLGAGMVAGLVLLLVGAGGWLVWQTRSSQLEAARKGSFVSNVSHELKTPLTTIRMYAELLSEGRLADADKRQRYLDTVVSECKRLTRLVNNVLDFSRIEQGKANVELKRLDLGQVLGSFAERRREELAARGFVLEIEPPPAGLSAMADADGLAQILDNLCDNAVKYASEGKWLGIAVSETANAVSIRVADRGPGLSRQARRRLFEPFERGDDSLTASQSGVGLGLSIARGLAIAMGGELRLVEEERNGGACFELRLRNAV